MKNLVQETANTIALQAEAIANGTVRGPLYAAVRRLRDNVDTLVACTPDDRS